jgi:hypothetical protein
MFGKKTGGLLLAGLAAYAWYKYNKMTPEERSQAMSGIKEKGQKLYDDYVPNEVKNMFGKKQQPAGAAGNTSGSEFVV